jgi:hypothetical protein
LCKQVEADGYEVWFWHTTPFDIESLGYKALRITAPKLHPLTSSVKNAKKYVALAQFEKSFSSSIYRRYWFPLKSRNLKQFLKHSLTKVLIVLFNSKSGLMRLRGSIKRMEQRTLYYERCLQILENHQPQLIYNTSQRSVLAIAPVEAAKVLHIPTVGFVYSWDNLPKATLDVETDYYHVWSAYMKAELLKYYPFIRSNQVAITGTPQFEAHYKQDEGDVRSDFHTRYGLDSSCTYICFSGDDVTTSPQDPLFLRDVAEALRHLNTKGHHLGLLFRRCPVDVSKRYDWVLEAYADVITAIDPLWENKSEQWNTIFPLPEDNDLLREVAQYCAAVVNLGSSMVFDFAIHNKPCLYLNYTYQDETVVEGVHVYDYMHFKSKPHPDVVAWLDSPDAIADTLVKVLAEPDAIVEQAKAWFGIINTLPAEAASVRICEHLNHIVNQTPITKD